MIQLLLGGIAAYTLYQNRKAVRELNERQEQKEATNDQPNIVTLDTVPPDTVYIESNEMKHNINKIIDHNGDEWHLATPTDFHIGQAVLFIRKKYTLEKYIGIIKKINKTTLLINSITQLEPYITLSRSSWVINKHCVYVCYDEFDEYDDEFICKGEINY